MNKNTRQLSCQGPAFKGHSAAFQNSLWSGILISGSVGNGVSVGWGGAGEHDPL